MDEIRQHSSTKERGRTHAEPADGIVADALVPSRLAREDKSNRADEDDGSE